MWVVLVGSEAGGRCAGVDLVVTSAASGFFPDPRRHVTALPLVRCDPSRLREAAEPWRKHFDESSAPRIGLLVDGARLSPASARALGEAVARRARSRGGRVFPCASDRTPRPVLAALESGLGVSAHVEARDGAFAERGDAYLAHLALADEFVVADDDERVVADACSRARPVSLWPLPPSPRGPGELLRAGVAHMARAPRANNRGTVRPQQGLERFCSRLIQGQWLRPPRDPLAALAAAASLGAVERLDGSEPGVDFRPLADAERAAGRVRRLLGID